MDVQQIKVTRDEARVLYRKYKEHAHYSTPLDREIQRAYQLIAQGRLVIDAVQAVKDAGVDLQGRPKLALVRADAKMCYWDPLWSGRAGTFQMDEWPRGHRGRQLVVRDWPAIPAKTARQQAVVPLIPVEHRPKRGLANYHVLFEAVWEKAPPVDPMLLRRIGKSDLWVVLAQWDLTEVERAVLKSRMN